MAVQPGTKLGPYEILAQIGSGGMGEVYKAADTRLNRVVAIKVLPPHFSENSEMKQRFEREAQTIAKLNHPHICTLHDVGTQDGSHFLVMEYLEGETLQQRLQKGPLPIDEALKVAIAVADALERAHSHGITHRDLKPGNIMLTQSGAKLLDFGLAKLRLQAQAPGSSPSLSSMPTSADTTTPGTVLGTMQYMAPEQLEGHEADARTDIFAFGVVLYEMIAGKKAFSGRSQALLIAAIMSVEPEPLSKIPGVPPALDYVVKRCMAKDREERLQTAMDLVSQLRWIAGGGEASGAASPSSLFSAGGRRQRMLPRIGLAVAAVLVAAMALPAFRYYRSDTTAEETRFLITVPDMPVPEAVSISPDGRSVAFSARDSASSFVFVRPINSDVATKLAGTDGAGQLFWSPDNRSIAFFAGGKLKRVDAGGGPPQNICETSDFLGGTWNAENVILFASSKGLLRVPAAGGDPTTVTTGVAGKAQEPYFLPDGHHYLYLSSSGDASGSSIYAGTLDSKDSTRLVSAQSNAAYAEPGYLLYHRDGTLYAQQFNPNKLTLSGDALRIADKIPYSPNGAAAFSASQTGILIFRNSPQLMATTGNGSNGNTIPAVPLLWVDHSGMKISQAAAPGGYAGVDLSPDGKHAAVHRHDTEGGDIYIFETGKDTPSKFTFDAAQDNSMPIWSPDGTRIAFGSHRAGKWGLYVKLADNSKNEEPVLESEAPVMPMSWTIDGRLVYWTSSAKTAGDIWVIPLNGDKKPIPFLDTPADERNPQVSTDGKWIAYSSNETGRSEIYIRPFPEGPAKIQVSVNGGVFPRWRRDGKELYFMSLVSLGDMLASDIHVAGASIQRDVPHILFESVFVISPHIGGQYHAYAVSQNGQQFLIPQYENLPALYTSAIVGRGRGATLTGVLPAISADRHAATAPSSASTAPITVVLNWTTALKKGK